MLRGLARGELVAGRCEGDLVRLGHLALVKGGVQEADQRSDVLPVPGVHAARIGGIDLADLRFGGALRHRCYSFLECVVYTIFHL